MIATDMDMYFYQTALPPAAFGTEKRPLPRPR